MSRSRTATSAAYADHDAQREQHPGQRPGQHQPDIQQPVPHDGHGHGERDQRDAEQHRRPERAGHQPPGQRRDDHHDHGQDQPQQLPAGGLGAAPIADDQGGQRQHVWRARVRISAKIHSGPQPVVEGQREVRDRAAVLDRHRCRGHLQREQRRGDDDGDDHRPPARGDRPPVGKQQQGERQAEPDGPGPAVDEDRGQHPHQDGSRAGLLQQASPPAAPRRHVDCSSPPAANSQPIGFRGRCQARIAPHTPKLSPITALVTTNASSASAQDQPSRTVATPAARTARPVNPPSAAASTRRRQRPGTSWEQCAPPALPASRETVPVRPGNFPARSRRLTHAVPAPSRRNLDPSGQLGRRTERSRSSRHVCNVSERDWSFSA